MKGNKISQGFKKVKRGVPLETRKNSRLIRSLCSKISKIYLTANYFWFQLAKTISLDVRKVVFGQCH